MLFAEDLWSVSPFLPCLLRQRMIGTSSHVAGFSSITVLRLLCVHHSDDFTSFSQCSILYRLSTLETDPVLMSWSW